MTIRPAENLLPPRPAPVDRKALRAFWRGVLFGMIAMAPFLRVAFLWGTWQ